MNQTEPRMRESAAQLPPEWPRFSIGEPVMVYGIQAVITKITKRGIKAHIAAAYSEARIGSIIKIKSCEFRVMKKRGPDLTLSPVVPVAQEGTDD